MRRIILTVLVLFSFTTLVGCTDKTRIPDDGPLIIGMECAYAPFNWTETSSNEYTLPIANVSGAYADGYDVQIAKYLSEELDRDVEIRALDWDALILELKAGAIHLIIAGMSPTEVRKEQIEFTNGYYSTSHVILMKKDSQYETATQLSDFSGAKAVAQKATIYDDLVSQLTGVTHQTPLDTVPLVVAALTSGVSDISIVERPVAQALVAANPSLTFITLEESFVLEESDAIVSIGLNYGNEDYVEQINAALAKLTEEKRTEIMDAAVSRQKDE